MAKRVKIETRDLRKSFGKGELTVHVLKGIDVVIHEGEWLAIMGRSGAGKSTLMYQLSLLDDATGGEIRIDGRDVHTFSEREKMQFRLTKFGYVFQDYALLPELTALENVIVPLLMERYSLTDAT
ncbi:MAG TPA: ATP-binding cassette domain-containing protein, partial [Candidatus Paceibacterota bacterium]